MNKMAALVVAAIVLALGLVVVRTPVDTEPDAPAPSPAQHEPTIEARPSEAAAPEARPPGAAPGVAAAAPEAAATEEPAEPTPIERLEPADKGGQPPSAALADRVDASIDALPPEDQPEELSWDCADGGGDCSLTGVIPSNRALADLAKSLEGPPPSGDAASTPTVEIVRIQQTENGKAFELGLFVP